MDPLSALSVAAAVFQFISFGCSLVSVGQEYRDSAGGALLKHVECDETTTRLVDLTHNLRLSEPNTELDASPAALETRRAIEKICKNCIGIAGELLALLQKLKIEEGSKSRRWKSFRHALRSIWSQNDLDAVEKRLLSCRRELDSHMIADIRISLNALQLQQHQILSLLDDKIQAIIKLQINNASLLKTKPVRDPEMDDMVTEEELEEERRSAIENNKILANTHLQNSQLNGETKNLLAAYISNDENWSSNFLEKLIEIIQSGTIESPMSCEKLYNVAQSRINDMQLSLLMSLKYPAMLERHENIDDTHRETFEWIFQNHKDDSIPWDSFTEWLETGEGVYWINGKAGSGKSTLMRYIYDHRCTIEHLKVWSNGSKAKMTPFFFWHSGTKLQRSQNGLFRSLLYEALHDQPELVPEIFPSQWAEARDFVQRGASIDTLDWNWSLKTLQDAFSRLTASTTISTKFCFFIDGLDEYEGDHHDISQFFKDVALRSHMKLCVSSRPWLVFEEAFRRCPSLKLQDLTHGDVQAYALDTLTENSKIMLMGRTSLCLLSDLISEIAAKAEGVFLWVRLVVRSLLRGLQNRDDISELQRRILELPGDLRSLYRVMIHQIEPLYWPQASRIFQIYSTMLESKAENQAFRH